MRVTSNTSGVFALCPAKRFKIYAETFADQYLRQYMLVAMVEADRSHFQAPTSVATLPL